MRKERPFLEVSQPAFRGSWHAELDEILDNLLILFVSD